MASPVAPTISPEVISIIFENVDHTEDIKACSLACRLWRELSQQILFKNMRFHLSEGPYDIIREEYRHIGKYVKDIQLEGTESESDIFPDEFPAFLDCLSTLRCLRLQIPKMDWSTVPPPVTSAIVRLLRLPCLEELHVSNAVEFPLQMPLCCTRLKALSIWETEVTTEGSKDIVIHPEDSLLTVENLKIQFRPSLKGFRKFLLDQAERITLATMTVLHIRYIETPEEEVGSRDVGLFLSSFGAPVEKLDFTVNKKGEFAGYQFTTADLNSLQLLRELSAALVVRGNDHPVDSVFQWLCPILENLPRSAPLRKFEFVCTIFFQGTPELLNVILNISTGVDQLLAKRKHSPEVVVFHFNYHQNVPPPETIRLTGLFPNLARKGIKPIVGFSEV